MEYLDQIDDAIETAKDYAETYLEYKVNKSDNNVDFASRYKAMAEDEINHALFLNDVAISRIGEINEAYTPPVEISDVWEKSNHKHIEKIAWVKQILAL